MDEDSCNSDHKERIPKKPTVKIGYNITEILGIFGEEKKNGSQDAMQIDEDSLTPKIKI
ncbi:hypothetical protein HK100_007081, partial [Physocladia obscura]